MTAVVLPPDSEVVANCSIDGGQLGTCVLINPNRDLAEDFGVIVGHTLVDATTPSANVLIINPNAEEVVLPCGTHIGDLVPVLAVSVARSDLQGPVERTAVLPDYLEDFKGHTLPWEIPVVNPYASYFSGTNMYSRRRESRSPVVRNRSNMKLKLMKDDRSVVVHAAWHRPDSEGNRTVLEKC